MNRIVIIGNGFDLAHGLKTSYKDFVAWYWESWVKKLHQFDESWKCSDQLCSFEIKAQNQSWKSYLYYNNTLAKWNGGEPLYGLDLIYNFRFDNSDCECKITSDLFQAIVDKIDNESDDENWLGIEEDYYRLLCEAKDVLTAKKLNNDLAYIKEKLAEYLASQNATNYAEEIKLEIYKSFVYKEIANSSKDKWEEFVKDRLKNKDNIVDIYADYGKRRHDSPRISSMIDNYAEKDEIDYDSKEYEEDERILMHAFLPENVLLLDFNYTKTTEYNYLPAIPDKYRRCKIIHIHGTLEEPQKIIFGYGDDNDDEYQILKKKKQNEYLRNIKSINYLLSPEYRSLLSFMELGSYQVCTMGHSCGNSDGTLLNTLFEHDNCVSIKPYYYLRKNGTDDYFDIVGSISRNFTKPQLMRDRVVNKQFCKPLPQCNDNK